jgi:hypothetical protein
MQHLGVAGIAGEGTGKRVNEDLWVFIEQEVGSTVRSRPYRSAAWTLLFHWRTPLMKTGVKIAAKARLAVC